MGYFLVVDKKVLKYSNDFHKVLETLADMYGGRVSIEYYGLITKEEMLSMEYMDIHEGSYFFIAGLELIDWDTGARRDISIDIYHSMYLMEYVDDEDEDGYAIIEWLNANKDSYYLDYSKSDFKKYCVMRKTLRAKCQAISRVIRDYYIIKLTNQDGMFSSLPKGQMPASVTGKKNAQ